MKLYIGENLKRLRLAKGLTQEQLADEISASVQSVSRWEVGSSYPDVEMIPAIALFFGVSTDELMGVNRAAREERLKKDWEKFKSLDSVEDAIALLRKMHEENPEDKEVLVSLLSNLRSEKKPDWQERKRLTEKLFSMDNVQKTYRDYVAGWLIASAPEEELPALLEQYCHDGAVDMSRDAVLAERFERDDPERAMLYRQSRQLMYLHRMLLNLNNGDRWNIADCERAVRRRLALLNFIAGTDSGNLISGDGEPDLWYSERIKAGMSLACYCASTDRKEEAFRYLDDCADLFEKFYSMPEGTVLIYRCPELDRLKLTWYTGVRNPDDVENFGEGLVLCKRSAEKNFGMELYYDPAVHEEEFDHNAECPVWDMLPLLAEEGWDWFDPIREDPRFKEIVKRMERFVIPVEKGAHDTFASRIHEIV